MRATVMAALLLAAAVRAQDAPAPDAPVTAEFRVFAGTEEITATTRLRIMPTGVRSQASEVKAAVPLTVTVPPGIYDVQALRMRPEGIVGIKWAERLVVMHYPDEGGRHLEVINFEPGYGALQLRAGKAPIGAYDIAVFPAGERQAETATMIRADDYRLFVVKAGRYDIRVRPAGANAPQDTHWLLDVEVPADRTRFKQVDGS